MRLAHLVNIVQRKRHSDVTSQPNSTNSYTNSYANTPLGQSERTYYIWVFPPKPSRRKIKIRAKLQQKESHFISFYSQLSPCAHLAITDTPIKRTAVKSQEKPNYRRLTEINSRYYGLSLMRTLTWGPYSVRYKGSWRSCFHHWWSLGKFEEYLQG